MKDLVTLTKELKKLVQEADFHYEASEIFDHDTTFAKLAEYQARQEQKEHEEWDGLEFNDQHER